MKDVAFKDVVLEREDEIPPGKRPRVSLCVVLTEPTLLPHLAEVARHVDEACFVVVGPADPMYVHEALDGVVPVRSHVLSPDDDSAFVTDSPEAYSAGQPLAGEEYPGPFTGRRVVANWSAVRNVALDLSDRDWRLCLYGRDVLHDPACLPSVCHQLDLNSRDAGYVLRSYPSSEGIGGRSTLEGVLVRRLPALRYEGVAREALEGSVLPAAMRGCLEVTSRPPFSDANTFKTLYANARRSRWGVPPADLLHMANTAIYAGMTIEFAKSLVDAYLEQSLYPEGRAWACAIRGGLEAPASASRWYERSLEECPGWKSSFRLCRSRFMEQKWKECVDAYVAGTESQDVLQLEDDGRESASASLIFYAIALAELGRLAEARDASTSLRALFPNNLNVLKLCAKIET